MLLVVSVCCETEEYDSHLIVLGFGNNSWCVFVPALYNWFIAFEECQKEIQSVHDKVKELTGQEMCLFRPPYGDYNDTLIEAAEALHYYTIQWNCDSLDWKNYGADAIVSRILDSEHLGNGSIILMHNGAKYTKDALPRVIEGLHAKGYEIVPVSQLIYRDHYEMDHEGRQFQN